MPVGSFGFFSLLWAGVVVLEYVQLEGKGGTGEIGSQREGRTLDDSMYLAYENKYTHLGINIASVLD
jgi:hypothetical protein